MVDPGVAEIAHLIDVRVRGGADDFDAIVAAVRDQFGPDDIDDVNLTRWVSDALGKQADAEADWPDETDNDRLDATLAGLLRQGVIARQDAGADADAALVDVATAYVAAGGEAAGLLGFCFYDHQDLLAAADGDDLRLSFGEPHGDPDGGLHIGNTIRDALTADGFAVVWDGTLGDRIGIADLVWRRRRSW